VKKSCFTINAAKSAKKNHKPLRPLRLAPFDFGLSAERKENQLKNIVSYALGYIHGERFLRDVVPLFG
jgi:hypothetical protein